MNSIDFQPLRAKNKKQYLQMLSDSVVNHQLNPDMTDEQYEYEMTDHLIYSGHEFVVYRWYGSEYFISNELNGIPAGAFFLHEIEKTKVKVFSDGTIEVSWDEDCDWPTVLDYIEQDGFPIQFKLFKEYGK